MEIEIKSQRTKFTKEEKEEFLKMLYAERKALWRRPLHVIGNIICIGLIFYFMFRTFGVNDFSWFTAKGMIGIFISFLIGFVCALLFKRLSKASLSQAITFGMIMVLVGVRGAIAPSSQTQWNWTYFAYLVFTFIGFILSCTSIEEHYCEKIYLLQKKESNQS